jgi:hypothetical protein
MTKCGVCQFCPRPTAHGNTSVCPACIDNIVSRGLAGEPMRSISEDYGATRNAIIGLFGRNKPEGTKHPGGQIYAPRKPRPVQVMVVTSTLYGPPNDPMAALGCFWIDHEGEQPYGNHAPDARRRRCQAEKQRGSSFCPTHHARVWVPVEEYRADRADVVTKFRPRLSRRSAPQAYQ